PPAYLPPLPGPKWSFPGQPALERVESAPAPRPPVLIRPHRARAMRATDARIILVVQRIIGHVVGADIFPDLLPIPVRDRIELHQTKFRVPFQLSRSSTRGCLIAANTCNPCSQA